MKRIVLTLVFFFLFIGISQAASISVAVAKVTDSQDLQGDIIAVKPGGWQWGTIEVQHFLILEIGLPLNISASDAHVLQSTYYANGVLNVDDALIIADRRFNIDWKNLKTVIKNAGLTVNWVNVENLNIAYQPLSEQEAAPGGITTILDPTVIVFDKYANRYLQAQDFSNFITGE